MFLRQSHGCMTVASELWRPNLATARESRIEGQRILPGLAARSQATGFRCVAAGFSARAVTRRRAYAQFSSCVPSVSRARSAGAARSQILRSARGRDRAVTLW